MSVLLRQSSLSLFFLVIFLGALLGQALVGHSEFNHQQVAHQDETISLLRYVQSSQYWVDVLENWQSEYLQFVLFVMATVWLVQKGSTESKQLDKAGSESDEEQKLGEHLEPDSPKWAKAGGWRTAVYSNSLVLTMGAIWIGSWVGQAITGRIAYNAEQLDHQLDSVTLWQYVGTAEFWNRTLQNWQSEFLAVGSMVVFSIYLRQRGSSQSKPVGAAHAATAEEG